MDDSCTGHSGGIELPVAVVDRETRTETSR